MEVGRVAFRCKSYPWEIYCTMAGKTNIDRDQYVIFLTLHKTIDRNRRGRSGGMLGRRWDRANAKPHLLLSPQLKFE